MRHFCLHILLKASAADPTPGAAGGVSCFD